MGIKDEIEEKYDEEKAKAKKGAHHAKEKIENAGREIEEKYDEEKEKHLHKKD